MFLSQSILNEGGNTEGRFENRKREFYEGENPKSIVNLPGGQIIKEKSHVNYNWQKLRK